MKNVFLAITWFVIVAESSCFLVHRSRRNAETVEAIPYEIADLTVTCTLTTEFSYFGMKNFKTCLVTQNIDSESHALGPDINPAIELFNISNNKEVKYLPQDIGVKLPNLKQFKAEYAGLTIIRDFNLKNMQNVQFLGLYHNEIKTIEPKAFDDLLKVERMHLDYNKLETLDEKLFATMVALQYLNLNYNKIKTLKPLTFEIPNGKLDYVTLVENVCVDKIFSSYSWNKLESHLKDHCSE